MLCAISQAQKEEFCVVSLTFRIFKNATEWRKAGLVSSGILERENQILEDSACLLTQNSGVDCRHRYLLLVNYISKKWRGNV